VALLPQFPYEDRPFGFFDVDVELLQTVLLWIMGCFSSNSRVRFEQLAWNLGRWLQPQRHRPENFWNNPYAFVLSPANPDFGRITLFWHDRNVVRALAQTCRSNFQLFGSLVCSECRRRKGLQYFHFTIGKYFYSCRFCNERYGSQPAGGCNVRARLLWGWLGLHCLSHPVCGTCYFETRANLQNDHRLTGARSIPLSVGTGPLSSDEFDWMVDDAYAASASSGSSLANLRDARRRSWASFA
jgi:hypothetical protein